ncbi:MAG: IS30 family transposase [Rhodospirillales bacterium]|jgi:transposase, IS30 family|nr:IS30 family transposase [Rhodospirillales bacterium]
MPKAYHHLTRDQRCQIYALKKRGLAQAKIAVDIGVTQGTISRELARNKGFRGYRFLQAHRFAVQRSLSGKGVARVMTPCLITRVETFLRDNQWSPEQICGALNLEDSTKVSHESLYRHIWSDKRAGGALYLHLRQRGKKRNKRGAATAGRGLIPGRVDIDERPAVVNEKSRVGDWELDSIVGAKHKGAITSMVERKTKLTKLVLLEGRTSEDTKAGIIKRLEPLKEHVLTLTADNGKEFASHGKISEKLDADFYFCHPYHSWERGLNENTNGLVRQYFPKGTDFAKLKPTDVQRVEDLLNNRPRKTLNYRSPNEVFAKLTAPPEDYALGM